MNNNVERAMRNKKQSTIRLIALVICAVFIAGALLSSVFIFTHINHEHDHNTPDGGCATCVHISAAENLSKSLSTAMAMAVAAIGGLSGIRSVLEIGGTQFALPSLVILKIRLNN